MIQGCETNAALNCLNTESMICKATITGVSRGRLKVKTLGASSGCCGCGFAQSCCSSKQTAAARYTVRVDDTSPYKLGQEIYLEQAGVTRRPLVIYGVVVPLAVLALMIVAFIGNEDPTLGTAAGIIAVALYFLVMRRLRVPLSPRPQWRVRRAAGAGSSSGSR